MRIRPVNMEFLYGSSFMSQSPEAYERLILDAMRGEATLFTRDDEVIAQWSIIDPILKAWKEDQPRRWPTYAAGSPGPAAADELIAPRDAGGGCWHDRRGLARARHDAGQDRGGAAATCSIERYHDERRVRARARAEPRGGRRRRVPRRDREPARARRPLPPVAARDLRGRARAARRSTRGRASAAEDEPKPGTIAVGARAGRARHRASAICRQARHDRRPAAGPGPRDDGVGAARPRRGGRRAAPAGADRADRLAGRARRRGGARRAPSSCASDAYVVDLAWLRSTPWRERVAAAFDPPRAAARAAARSREVTVRHRADSLAAALLFCGWLSSRLGWRPGALAAAAAGAGAAHARAPRGRRSRCASSRSSRSAPGLAGVTIEMASGRSVSLDRAPGRAASRVRRDARRHGAGVDRAGRLARRGAASSARACARRCCAIPTYRPALRSARVMAGASGCAAIRMTWRSRCSRTRRPRSPSCSPRPPRAAATSCSPAARRPARLRARRASADGDWSRATVWFSDERCVPPDQRGCRTSRWRTRRCSSRLSDGRRTVVRMEGELGAEAAAGAYEALLRERWAPSPRFDLVLLGLGPDATPRRCSPASRRSTSAARLRRSPCRSPGMEPQVPRITLTLPGPQRRARGRVPRHRRRQGRRDRARLRRPARSRGAGRAACARAPARCSSCSTRPRRRAS